MTTSNLDLWNQVCTTAPGDWVPTPYSNLKNARHMPIETAIKKLTERFGPAGKGWGLDDLEVKPIPMEMMLGTATFWIILDGERLQTDVCYTTDMMVRPKTSTHYPDTKAAQNVRAHLIKIGMRDLGYFDDIFDSNLNHDQVMQQQTQQSAEQERSMWNNSDQYKTAKSLMELIVPGMDQDKCKALATAIMDTTNILANDALRNKIKGGMRSALKDKGVTID